MAYHEMLPQEMLDFQRELKNWPMISAEMQSQPSFEAQLGACAARLGILLDGMYNPLELCAMLTKKLYEMRTTEIYIPSTEFKEIRIKEGENEVIIEQVPHLLPKKED